MKIDVEEVVQSEYTLEDVLVLVGMEYARRGKFFPYSSTRPEQYISLYKRGVLNAKPEGYSISVTGYEELRKILGKTPLKIGEEVKQSKFEEFWDLYPVSDKHGNWLRTRTLKSDKAKCLNYYNKALKNGIKHSDIIKALKWEIKDRKNNSSLKNKMSFMKASSAWLYQREYEVINEAMVESEDTDQDGDWTQNTI